MYSEYYQAKVLKEKTWFLSACFRNETNLTFARALAGEKNCFEFFVTKDQEEHFLYVIKLLQKKGVVLSFEKMPNRLKEE